jgi:hypothetical protein
MGSGLPYILCIYLCDFDTSVNSKLKLSKCKGTRQLNTEITDVSRLDIPTYDIKIVIQRPLEMIVLFSRGKGTIYSA